MDLIPTTVIVQAAMWASPKWVLDKDEDGTQAVEAIEAFDLKNVTVKNVEGPRSRTKMIFWFENNAALKKVALAHSNRKLLVDANTFHQKYLEFRNMTFNKGFAADCMVGE
jgi:hypothetical protein